MARLDETTLLHSKLEMDVDFLASEFGASNQAELRRLVFDTYAGDFGDAQVTEFIPLLV